MVKLFESEVENINSLPLVDAYLELQVNNLALVDANLRELESQMARGYRIDDKLPQPLTMLVSALSQLWVFGLYEILRTWKQRISEVIGYGEQLGVLRARSREEAEAFIHRKREETQNEAGRRRPV